jgi:hypothetical protein
MEKIISAITRPRYILFFFLLVSIPLLDILTDTETGIINDMPFGAGLLAYLVLLGRAVIAVLALHWLVAFIFDCLELDIVKTAKLHPEHNGLYAVAVAIYAVAFAVVISSVLSL